MTVCHFHATMAGKKLGTSVSLYVYRSLWVYISAFLFIFAFAQDLHVTFARKPIGSQNHARLASDLWLIMFSSSFVSSLQLL